MYADLRDQLARFPVFAGPHPARGRAVPAARDDRAEGWGERMVRAGATGLDGEHPDAAARARTFTVAPTGTAATTRRRRHEQRDLRRHGGGGGPEPTETAAIVSGTEGGEAA